MKITRRGFALSPALLAAVPEKPLSGNWPAEKLGSVLIPRESWRPFPPASDRSAWEALPAEVRRAALERGTRQAGHPWEPLPASVFLDFKRNGNRSRFEHLQFGRRSRLREVVVAECVQGQGRFQDDILNGIWTTCEETFWGVPAHLGMQKRGPGLPDISEPVVDLFAAETGALLAWVAYLLPLEPLVRERIAAEIGRRILRPCLERDDFWWMGFDPQGAQVNNWNPWINSNWLTCALLAEADPRRRLAAVSKSLRSLDAFLNVYHPDGGCDEGPSYWGRAGGSLFDCLELFYSATGGKVDFYSRPLVREIGRYIYRAHIAGDWFVDFADASARLRPEGDLIYRYGKRIGDERMQGFGAYFGARDADEPSLGRELPALFNAAELARTPRREPLVRDVWLDGIQVMAARPREGSSEGLYLAAKAGHNAESHNHNDVGNFIVYANGQPAIVDVGVETYTAKTFSAQRYHIWTMQSANHNLPTIGGVMQAPGREFEARNVEYQASEDAVEFRQDIARAYPKEAGLVSWKRVLRLDRRQNRIQVSEKYALERPVDRIDLTLMTPCRVKVGPGELLLEERGVAIRYDAALTPKVEEIAISDPRLKESWGERLYRILLTASRPPQLGLLHLEIQLPGH